MKKLFILGNGFDLTLGLNSRYIDFYKGYVSKYKDDYSKMSFWELLLGDIDKEKNNWIDIETEIEKMLIEINSKNALNLTLKEVIDKINYIVNLDDKEIIYNQDIDLMYKKKLFIQRNDILRFLNEFIENNNKDNENNKIDNEEIIFSNFLSDQLLLLQKHFNEYMKAELDDFNVKVKNFYNNHNGKQEDNFIEKDYNDTSLKLLYELNGKSNNFKDISILNFNYTSFKVQNADKYTGNIEMLNIHGNLNKGDIIIGSDLKIINQGNGLIPFTKPFKIVNNVNGIDNENFGILKYSDNIDHIIFFGHSLGDTDFNYFKSIFDAVNIYEEKVNLTFYIPIYDSNKKMKIISEYEASILNLLTQYSKTLNNIKEDDVSLFTKLLLEGRLNIKNLEYSIYEKYNLTLCKKRKNDEKKSQKEKKRKKDKEHKNDIFSNTALDNTTLKNSSSSTVVLDNIISKNSNSYINKLDNIKLDDINDLNSNILQNNNNKHIYRHGNDFYIWNSNEDENKD